MVGYDAVVVGSGHNALVAAAYLARAGWGVLVLEGNDRPGGLVRTDQLTLPGFVHDNFSAAHPLFVAGPAYADLRSELDMEYLNTRYPTGVSLPDGRSSVVSTDLDENIVEANRLAPGDGDAMGEIFKEFGPAIETGVRAVFGRPDHAQFGRRDPEPDAHGRTAVSPTSPTCSR